MSYPITLLTMIVCQDLSGTNRIKDIQSYEPIEQYIINNMKTPNK